MDQFLKQITHSYLSTSSFSSECLLFSFSSPTIFHPLPVFLYTVDDLYMDILRHQSTYHSLQPVHPASFLRWQCLSILDRPLWICKDILVLCSLLLGFSWCFGSSYCPRHTFMYLGRGRPLSSQLCSWSFVSFINVLAIVLSFLLVRQQFP